MIFFDVPDGVSVGGDDPFRVRIAIEEPLLKPCPEADHVLILQKRDVTGKLGEKTFAGGADEPAGGDGAGGVIAVERPPSASVTPGSRGLPTPRG